MDQHEFEQFVLENGKNILRFCRLTCQETESGDELYQDTMLKLSFVQQLEHSVLV